MTGPRFSLVVPTRNRARTLAFCLRTCLAQAFDDFEVIVGDNHSPPETRELALSFGDPRIKYFRTPADLSVTDSFEFALEKATGEYVTILGDDDGCLLHALAEIDKLLRLAPTSALQWSPALYTWPDVAEQAYAKASTLVVPLRQTAQGCVLQRHESRPMIEAAANGEISYADLPMPYCCAVAHRDVFARLRRQAGRVFKSRAPDVYLAFAVAHAAGSYYAIAAPLTIAGASGASTGNAHLHRPGSDIDRQFRSSSEGAGHGWHRTVPNLPSLWATVADSALHFRETLAPEAAEIDRRRLVTAVLGDIVVDSAESWQTALAACRRSLEDDDALLAWFDATHAARPLPEELAVPRQQVGRRYGGTFIALDASEYGVGDVYGAAQVCERLLGYGRDGIDAVLREDAAGPAQSLSELHAKERKIQEMHQMLRAQHERQRVLDDHLQGLQEQLRTLDAHARALGAEVEAARAAQRRAEEKVNLKSLIPPVLRRAIRNMRNRR
jgi:hypothetical protein